MKFLRFLSILSFIAITSVMWAVESHATGHDPGVRHSISQEDDCDSAPFYESDGGYYVYIPNIRSDGYDYYLHLAYFDGNPQDGKYFFYGYDSWYGLQKKSCDGGYSSWVESDGNLYLYIPSFYYDYAYYTIWLIYQGSDEKEAGKHWFSLHSMEPH